MATKLLNKQHRKYYLAASVSFLTFIVYAASLKNDFVLWDDNRYVYENPYIRSFDLNFIKWTFFDFYASNWHPLTWISHAGDYALWGLNPLGHHLTNNILHTLNTFLVVLLVFRLMSASRMKTHTVRDASFLNDTGMLIAGAFTGLLFGLHPVHVESVAWVAERKDVLCAFFFLLSLNRYAGYMLSGTSNGGSAPQFLHAGYLVTIVFFTLALLSKPMAVSLPFILLLLDWHPFERIQSLKTFGTCLIEKIPFILLSMLSAVLTVWAQRNVIDEMAFIPVSERALVALQSLIRYLWNMIFPVNLMPFYPYPEDISLLSPEFIVPLVLVAGITAACFVAARRWKLWFASWSYYVIVLIPVLGIIQVGGQSMADRYTYLPSLGPFFVAGVIAAAAYEKAMDFKQWRGYLRLACLFIALSVTVFLSYSTVKQIGIWKNSGAFWNYVIQREPLRVPIAYNNLGLVYMNEGRVDLAIEQYRMALNLRKDYAEAHYNLGNAYAAKGLIDLAIEQYRIALNGRKDYAEAHNNLGNAYAEKGQHDMAVEQYRTAISIRSDYAEAYVGLGAEYFGQGLFDPAAEQYLIALRLRPEFSEAHYNLGLIYLNKGSKDRAKTEFESALRGQPDQDKRQQILTAIGALANSDQ